ncbi:MAG: ATP-dependent Clp protease adaptor ClpS [Ignavibacteriaceae bacterium]
MEIKPKESQQVEIITEEATGQELLSRVVLFNDDWHTFDDVINQLIKATKCSFEKARDYAFEVHVKGKAIVFNGSLNECLKVTTILEEIALHTQIIT